jgi:hypothetical protein
MPWRVLCCRDALCGSLCSFSNPVAPRRFGLPDIRTEQHQREQKWKATGRDQIKQNTNFDMARSLFGGGGMAPVANDSANEDVEEVVKEVQKLAVDDDDEEQEVVEDEEEVVEEEVVEDYEEEDCADEDD